MTARSALNSGSIDDEQKRADQKGKTSRQLNLLSKYQKPLQGTLIEFFCLFLNQ